MIKQEGSSLRGLVDLPDESTSHDIIVLVERAFSGPHIPLVNVANGRVGGVPFLDAKGRGKVPSVYKRSILPTCHMDFLDDTVQHRPTAFR